LFSNIDEVKNFENYYPHNNINDICKIMKAEGIEKTSLYTKKLSTLKSLKKPRETKKFS